MKHLVKKSVSILLAIVMIVSEFTIIPVSASAAVDESVVDKLTSLYDGDDERARSDLDALYASGLIDDEGKMVELDVREDGNSVDLAELADRINKGETVGEITVNGSASSAEQIQKIAQMKAALEVAQLLNEEIDVTDEHVENLKSLVNGVADGTVDFQTALKTGKLALADTGAQADNLAGTGEENEAPAYTTLWNQWPTELTMSTDGTSYIAPYISGSTYEPNHAFYIDSGLSQYAVGRSGNRSKTSSTSTNGRWGMFDWDNAVVGVDDGDRLNPVVTVVLPLKSDDSIQNIIANDAAQDKLLDITENGIGVMMELPGYGEVNLKHIFRYMFFSYDDWHRIATGQVYGSNPRYPVYLVESVVEGSERVTAVATRFVAPVNTSEKVRLDALSLYAHYNGNLVDDCANDRTHYNIGWEDLVLDDENDGFFFKGTLGKALMPDNWSGFGTDAKGYRYFNADGLTGPVPGRCLPYYIPPATYLTSDKYTVRPEGSWEQAEAGFIKLKNPENSDLPYVYPKDTENPQNRYDVELMYTEDYYHYYLSDSPVNMGEDVDLRIGVRISDRTRFDIPDNTIRWDLTDVRCEHPDGNMFGAVWLTSVSKTAEAKVSVYPDGNTLGYTLSAGPLKVRDVAPYLLVPKSSRIRQTLTGKRVDIPFTTNIARVNKNDTTYHVDLYKIREDQIDVNANSIPEDAQQIDLPSGWTDFLIRTTNTTKSIAVHGDAIKNAGTYAVKISTECEDSVETRTYSAIVYLRVKAAPLKVKLDKLESANVDTNHIPEITYSLENEGQSAEVKYTVQPSGEAVGAMTDASDGVIPFAPDSFEGLKKAYIITVYGRNNPQDAWSVDSLLLTVYNDDILRIILKEVALGEVGGTTEGSAVNGSKDVTGDVAHMSISDRIAERLVGSGDGAGYKVDVDDFTKLRGDLSLQRVVSVNYGAGVWGVISDKMQWSKSADPNLKIYNKENGAYGDVSGRSHTVYIPTTDFLLVADGDINESDPVTITATHGLTGATKSFEVTVATLKDKFYMFRFQPKTTTNVTYTNGDGETRNLHSDANGELAVYEPSGIAGNVIAMSQPDGENGETYVGTIVGKALESGEKDIIQIGVYPCNNLTLQPISSRTLTFLKPDGSPYSGAVTLRAGIYKGGEYCPDFGVRISKNDINQIVREDIAVAASSDGETTLYYDPTQLMDDDGLTKGLRFVYEYNIDGYQPGFIVVDPLSDDPTGSIVNLKKVRGSAAAPQIIRQEYQQYYQGNRPTDYTHDVIDYSENLGVSTKFSKAILNTDIALPGETVDKDSNGYSTYQGEKVIKFGFYTTDGKKLTGQADFSDDNLAAEQIVNLNQLKNAHLFVFPFSAVPMLHSVYTMTDANLTADGITDQGENPTPSANIKAVFTRGEMTVRTMNMPFGVSNLSHQKDMSQPGNGAQEVGNDVKDHLNETTDIGSIFRSINVNDMIRNGFVFLGKLNSQAGSNALNMMILPTQDPSTFRIVAFVGSNSRKSDDKDGLSVNYNADDLYNDMSKFQKELEESGKKKDSESNGEGSMTFNFYGTIILEARIGVADGNWDITFRGGNVGTNVEGKYEWGQTFMCGPYPAFINFEIGFNADLEVAFGSKSKARAMLLDAALGVSIEAFAGLGFDLSLVALQLGIYGRIGADVNFLLLNSSDSAVNTMNGTKLDISGEIGIKLKVKLLFISYTEKFASTGFNWTRKWNNYDKIKDYWKNQGYAQLFGVTKRGRAYSMYLMPDGSSMVAIEGDGELESRDYLDMEERVWNFGTSSQRLLKAAGNRSDSLTDVQTNAYPYSNPVFTDDGEMFLYLSDNNNADETQSVVSYAVKNPSGYADKGKLDANDEVFADNSLTASGTKDHAFAAWIKQVETPQVDKEATVTNDDLSLMLNATEIYAARYNGTEWTTDRLTDNCVVDMAPTVASYGDKAIVAWRSLSASSLEEGSDITSMFNTENYINYRIYNGTSWTDAQVAYNGATGTVNAIDSAMLSDGTALLTYTVRTGEDVSTTETFYTVIGTDGNIVTTGRLTNDEYIDTNAQVTAVGNQFVIGWYSEHAAGDGMTSEYDEEGNATQKAVAAHDIRLAGINANGSYDIDFPESIGGGSDAQISPDFHFSAPVNNTSLENLSVVWSQRIDSDAADDSGKYELNAVRFFRADNAIGVTAPANIAQTDKNYTIDHFDTYTDADGAIQAILVGSDYNSIEGIEVYDSIDLSAISKELGQDESNSEDSNNLDILDGEAISSIKLATGIFPETAAQVTADVNISEVIPGFAMPVQVTVTNTGTAVINDLTATVGNSSKDFTGLQLLPNESETLLMSYEVPEGAVNDVDYTVNVGEQTLGSGTLTLNRPDVGISGLKLLRESDGTRDIQIRLTNNSKIPLAGSGKTVKFALYKDPVHKDMIGSEVEVSDASAFADIDAGVFTTVQTIDVTELYTGDEIPDEGLTVYAYAWVEDTEESDIYNNTDFLTFKGLLTKRNGEKITLDNTLDVKTEGENTVYTVYADIRNNSMQEVNEGIPAVSLLDNEGNVIVSKALSNEYLHLDKEQQLNDLSVTFTADELDGRTPEQATIYFASLVTYDVNGGEGTFESVVTDVNSCIRLPDSDPTPSADDPAGTYFMGWYTGKTDGEQVTTDSKFTEDTTVYAHYSFDVPYIFVEYDENTHQVKSEERTIAVPNLAEASKSTNWTTGWYAVTKDTTLTDRINVNGDVNLILCDGAALNATKGIQLTGNNTLTIYGRTESTGKLTASPAEGDGSAIGSVLRQGYTGTLIVNGGNVTANNSEFGAAIGAGSSAEYKGKVIVNGGKLTATGNHGAGIGTGYQGTFNGEVTFNCGGVTARSNRGAGVGAGRDGSGSGTLTLGAGVGLRNASGGGIVNPSDQEQIVTDRPGYMQSFTEGAITADDMIVHLEDTDVKINAYFSGDGALSYAVKSGDAVTVDDQGNLTLLKEGTSVITITATQSSSYAATKDVTVTVVARKPQTITPSEMTVYIDDANVNLNARTSGDGALSYAVKSGDAVTVDDAGNLTIVKLGTAVITVTAAETDVYAAASKDVAVTVLKHTQTITPSEMTVYIDDANVNLNARTSGDGALSYAVKSGDAVTVGDEGNLTLVKKGTAVITVTAAETDVYAAASKDVTVTVRKHTQTITAADVTAHLGDTGVKIVAETNGGGALSYAVKSGDAVTVDEQGNITPKKAGYAIITITAAETDRFDEATKDIHVKLFEPVSYLDEDGIEQTVTDFEYITESSATLSEGWYVVDENITLSERLSVTGDVRLILSDGAALNATKGIGLTSNNSLTIYGQTEGTGELTATAPDYNDAAIGTGEDVEYSGVLTVNGGTVTANGGAGACIGSGYCGTFSGKVIINGGTVTANGDGGAAGIGSGFIGDFTGEVTVNGGDVTASSKYGKGIGAGDSGTDSGTLTLGARIGLLNESGKAIVNPAAQEQVVTKRASYMKSFEGDPYDGPVEPDEPGGSVTFTKVADISELDSALAAIVNCTEDEARAWITAHMDELIDDDHDAFLVYSSTEDFYQAIRVDSNGRIRESEDYDALDIQFRMEHDASDTNFYVAGSGGGETSAVTFNKVSDSSELYSALAAIVNCTEDEAIAWIDAHMDELIDDDHDCAFIVYSSTGDFYQAIRVDWDGEIGKSKDYFAEDIQERFDSDTNFYVAGSSGEASAVTFTKVADISELDSALAAIVNCTEDEARAWIKAHMDELIDDDHDAFLVYSSTEDSYQAIRVYWDGTIKESEDYPAEDIQERFDSDTNFYVAGSSGGETSAVTFTKVADSSELDSALAAIVNCTEDEARAWITANKDELIADNHDAIIVHSSREGGYQAIWVYSGGLIKESEDYSASDIQSYMEDYASYINFYVAGRGGENPPSYDEGYTITWKNDDGTVIDATKVASGAVPTHDDPTKAEDDEYTYTFIGWNDGETTYAPTAELPEVTGNVTYTATFENVKRSYTITWKNDDGNVIDTTSVEYGKTPAHSDPVKENHTFIGWSPAITPVTGDAEYTATYSAVVKSYTVTWKNGDDVLKTITVTDGETPDYDGETPTKAADAENTYTFAGWTPTVDDEGNITYTATFTAIPKLFAAHSVSLGGNIGVNFYINSTAADFANAEKAILKFTWDDGNCSAEVDLKKLTANDTGWYKATCDVVAAQMAHKIHAEIYLDGEKLDEIDDFSVQDYAEKIYMNPEKYDDKGKPEQLKALAKALLNYGAMAQTVFDSSLKEKPALANVNVDKTPDFSDVTVEKIQAAIEAANPGKTVSDLNAIAAELGAKYYTNSLIYLKMNTLRIYFTPADGSMTMTDPDAYDGSLSDYYYYVDKENIPAAELDNLQKFTVNGVDFYFSVLDYAKAVLGSSMTETQKDLARSLYLYNQAANAYFD